MLNQPRATKLNRSNLSPSQSERKREFSVAIRVGVINDINPTEHIYIAFDLCSRMIGNYMK